MQGSQSTKLHHPSPSTTKDLLPFAFGG